MHKLLATAVCVIAIIITGCDQPTPTEKPKLNFQVFRDHIDDIVKNSDENLDIGIKVQTANSRKIIYQKNADRSFVPASNLKLFTAIAVLFHLGPNYHFDTTLFTPELKIKDGILESDLYFKFTGDPSFSTDNLNQMISALKKRGVKKITGKLYIDNTRFNDADYGPGWMWDDESYCFSAPVNAVMLDNNCFNVHLQTTNDPRRPIKTAADNAFIHVNNRIDATSDSKNQCQLAIKNLPHNNFILSGCVHKKDDHLELAITDPVDYASNVIAQLLQDQGIKAPQTITLKPVPQKAVVVVKHESPPLRELIATMLKESNNLYADSFFKTLGAEYFSEAGGWHNGQAAVKAILRNNAKLDLYHAVIVDGSGLSRYNLVSPAEIIDLLDFAYHEFSISYEILASLPIAGIDGTLHNRFTESVTLEKSRAKTGTMSHVSSLSGFVETNSQEILEFSILINGGTGKNEKYRELEDALVNYLSQLS